MLSRTSSWWTPPSGSPGGGPGCRRHLFFLSVLLRAPLCRTQCIWISQKGASTRTWVAWFVRLLRLSLWLLPGRHSWNLGLWSSTGSWLPWNWNTGDVLGSLPRPQGTAQIATEAHPHVSEKEGYLLILGLLSERPPEAWHAYWGLWQMWPQERLHLCPAMLPSPPARDLSHRAFFTLVWGLVFTPAAQGTALDVLVLRASACCWPKKDALPKSWELCFIRQIFPGLELRRYPLR